MTVNNDRILIWSVDIDAIPDLLLIQQKLRLRRSGMAELCYRAIN